jgi:hypothetical protein
MALVLADRVRDTTATTGTGTVTLSGTAPTGYQNFSVIGNANTTYYTINGDTQWEVGIGTYTSSGTTLSRNTVLASSNGGSLVNFAAGTKDVFVTYPSEKAVTEDYGNALAATTAANLAGGAAGSIPYQTAANTTAMLATGTGVLIGGTTPSYTMSPSLTQVTVAGDPSTALQVATKQYVDTQTSAGINYHEPVRVESPINLNATYNNGTSGVGATLTNAGTQTALVIDGVTLIVADRVLIYQQTNQTQNGIYVVTNVGSGSTNWVLTRSSDADTYVNASPDGLSQGSTVFVQQGTTGAGTTYTCNTTGTIVFGTTAITFVEISSAQIYSAGTGLTLTGTTFSLTSPVATTLGGTGLTSFTSGGAVYATSSSTLTTGTLPATAGGTGQSSYTAGDLVYATSSTTLGVIADVATGNALISGGAGGDPSYGKIGLTTHISGTLAVGNGGTGATSLTGYLVGNGTSAFTATATIPTSALSGTISLTTQVSGTLGAGNGGTGLSSYTVGDILYASGTTALSSLPDVATGNALISGGVSNAPLWGKIGLTTHVSGTLPVSNGGSGATTLTGYLKGNGTSAFTASATIPAGDITGAALTEIDDTNVTMTLGGSPSTALLAATSMTLGWTGQLAVSRGGTGNATLTSNYLLKGNGVSPVAASIIFDNGTSVGISTATPTAKLTTYYTGLYNTSTTRFVDITGDFAGTNPEVVSNAGAFTGLRMGTIANGKYAMMGAVSEDPAGYSRITGLSFWTSNLDSAPLERMRVNGSGNLGLNTTTPAGRLSVVSGSSTGVSTGAWSSNFSVFGPNAGNVNGAAVALGYNSAIDAAEILALAPGVAWKPLNIYSAGLNLFASSGGIGASLNGSGTFSAVTDIRAPIFYDSANTAYYVDPAGTSVLNGIGAGTITATNFLATNAFYVNGTTYYLNSTGGGWYSNARIQSETDMRAPIFYDSNNTGFFIDPASTSSLITLLAQNLGVYDSGQTNDPYGKIAVTRATDGNNYSYYGLTRAGQLGAGFGIDTSNRFWWGSATPGYAGVASAIGMTMSMGGILSVTNDVRAPVYYDSANTAFYADPASTSEFNTLQTRGGSGVRAFAAGSASISSQLYFADAGNTRAWNWQLDESNNAALWNFNGSSWNKRFTFTAGSDFTAGGNIQANAGIFTNNAFSRVLYLKGSGNIIQFQDADGTDRWENVGRNGTYYVYKNYGTGIGFKWQIDDSGNHTFTGIATFNTDVRSPIFYDSNNTAFYIDAASNSILNTLTLGNRATTNAVFYSGFTLDANTMLTNSTGFTYAVNAPFVGPIVRLGQGAYDLWFNAPYGGGGRLAFRTQNGDTGAFNSWQYPALYGQNVNGGGALYATIYYDQDNTTYYLDPATGFNFLSTGVTYSSTGSGLFVANAEGTGNTVRLGAAWSRAGSYSNGGYTLGSEAWIAFWISNSEKGYIDSSSNLLMNGSMRAPIFYDINDTAYYLDPNTTGLALKVNGNIECFARSAAWAEGVRIRVPTRANWGGIRFTRDEANSNGNWAIGYTGIDSTDDLTFWGNLSGGEGMRARLTQTGNFTVTNIITANGDMRAPIYYDSNNTAYYWNIADAALSNIYTTIIGLAYFRSNRNTSSNSAPLQAFSDDGGGATMAFHRGGYYAVNMGLDTDNVFRIGGWSAPNNLFQMDMSGNLTMAGNVTAYSDARLKKDVETIGDALGLVRKMRGVTYTRIDTDKAGVGVIAQEMLEVMPQVVQQGVGDDDTLSVAYGNLVGVLIEAIKELEARVAHLEGK